MVGSALVALFPVRDSFLKCFQMWPVGVLTDMVSQVALQALRFALRIVVFRAWHFSPTVVLYQRDDVSGVGFFFIRRSRRSALSRDFLAVEHSVVQL